MVSRRDLAVSVGTRFLLVPITFLSTIAVVQVVGAGTFGSYTLFVGLLATAALVSNFGLSGAIEARIAAGAPTGTTLAAAIKLLAIGLVPIALVIFFAIDALDAYIGEALARHLVPLLLLVQGAGFFLSGARGNQRISPAILTDFLGNLARSPLAAALVLAGFGMAGLLAGLYLQYVVMIIGGALILGAIRFGGPSEIRFLAAFAASNVVVTFGGFFYEWGDLLVLGLFVSETQVGVYQIAWRLSSYVLLISTAGALVVFPRLARLWAIGDLEGFRQLVSRATSLATLLAFPSLAGAILLGEDILGLLYGEAFRDGRAALIILFLEKVFQSFHGIVGLALVAAGGIAVAARFTMITLGLSVVLYALLIPRFGITGAAAGTALAFALNTILHAVALGRRKGLHLDLKIVGMQAFAAIVMGLVLSALKLIRPVTSTYWLAAALATGAVVYGAIILAFPSVRRVLGPGAWQSVDGKTFRKA